MAREILPGKEREPGLSPAVSRARDRDRLDAHGVREELRRSSWSRAVVSMRMRDVVVLAIVGLASGPCNMGAASAQEAGPPGASQPDTGVGSGWIKQVIARIQLAQIGRGIKIKSAARVQLSFVVARDGHLVASSVQTSSGVPAVDRAALAIVRAAAPFPKMPAAMQDDQLRLNLPLRFAAAPAPTKSKGPSPAPANP